MKKETKQFIKLSFAVHWALYLIGYLLYSFVIWELKNPFQWILNISKYDYSDRAALIGIIIMYVIGVEFIAFNIKLFKDGK